MANLPALTPTNFAEAMTFAEALAKSTMIPTAFQRNPSNILVAIQWGAELGLGPLQALQNIAVIGGRPAVYGDAMLALVRGSPVCEDVIEHIERQDDNRVAICEARRKGKEPVFARFSINDAKRAGLWEKPGPWKQYPLRMLQMRARGFALRDAFPDVLRGVISAEEAIDIARERETPPRGNEALRARLAAKPAAEPEESEVPPDVAEYVDDQDSAPAATAEAPEAIEEEAAPEGIAVVKPQRGPRGRGWNWAGYADELLEVARTVPRELLGQYRAANASMLNALRLSDPEEWSRVQQTLADIERGDAEGAVDEGR